MKRLPETGMARETIRETLADLRADDLSSNGRAFGFVYDAGREATEVAQEAFVAFMGKNGLDPTAYPSLLRLEQEIVAICKAHLGGGEDTAGTFTSGGTESCMLAVKTARDHARKTKGITAPEMLLPVTAHAAFHKGAKYLGVKVIPIPVDPETFEADLSAMRAAITPNTVLLVGSAAGFAHGVIDPIEEMGKLALEHDVLLHVDGCIGGWLLPFLRRHGAHVPAFDFSVPGVTSISMDLHKYAFAPKGASVVIYRDRELRLSQYFACAEWAGYSVINPTIQSTKSGGPLAGAWAVLHHFGDEGYMELAGRMHRATEELIAGIDAIDGLRVLGRPSMGLLAIASDTVPAFQLADALLAKGWYVQPQLSYAGSPANVHLMVEPSNTPHAGAFLADLRATVDELRGVEAIALPPHVTDALASLDPAMLDRDTYQRLVAMVGLGGEGVPKERALVNAVLDAMPVPLREALLTRFLNELFG